MKSFTMYSLNNVSLNIAVLCGAIFVFSFVFMPRFAHASAVTVSAFTATSTPAYTNTGLATTTRAKVADTIQYQLTLSGGAPLIPPQINILGTGSTTMTGSGNNWRYATTTTSNASVWNDGLVTFKVSVGQDTLVATATTTVTAVTSGSNITFDKTGPTLNSVSWSDVDDSTQFSATDTLTLTFNETMATTTITSGNVDTTLALSGSHTFGSSPTVSWNAAGTVLTLTLGTSPTLATADTVDPSTAVKDAIGNNDATPSALAVTDNVAPGSPTGISSGSYFAYVDVSLASVGSSQIRYTIDGVTPTCSTGTVYSGSFRVSSPSTVAAVGCDEADNISPVVTATYSPTSSGGGSGSNSSATVTPTIPVVPAVPTAPQEGCASGNLFSTVTGKPCTASSTATAPSTLVSPVVPAAFTSDFTVGSQGSDVKKLQVFLNTHGYTVATSGPGSPDSETSFFGGLTKTALIKYQKAKGIVPAVGYFGPKTRAAINAER